MPRLTAIFRDTLRHPRINRITTTISHQSAIREFNHSGVDTSNPAPLLASSKFGDRLSCTRIVPRLRIIVTEPYRRAAVAAAHRIAGEKYRTVLPPENGSDRHVSEAMLR